MVGFPNNHGVFLLKMIILGCEMGVPPFKYHLRKPPCMDKSRLFHGFFLSRFSSNFITFLIKQTGFSSLR